jgi:hypothetical protein
MMTIRATAGPSTTRAQLSSHLRASCCRSAESSRLGLGIKGRSFIPKPGEARIQQFIAEATQALIDGKASPDQAMNTFAANVT